MSDGDEVTFRYEKCTVERLPAVQALSNIVFPFRYPAADYSRAIQSNVSNASISWLAYDDTDTGDSASLVGALICRAESDNNNNDLSIYILTLAVVATYREQGIGTKLLEHGTNAAKETGAVRMYAHVQQGNEDALRLYRKFGFKEKETVENYYRRLRPPHAIIVEKCLETKDV